MRVVATSALALLLAGLALVPVTAAAPDASAVPPCSGTIGTTKTIGPVTVFASPPCYTVSVDPGCIFDHWYTETVQHVTVRINVCDGPTPPPTASTACTCPPPPRCTDVTTVGPLAAIASITISSDCRITVQLLRIVECSWPLGGDTVISQGAVTVTAPCGPSPPCSGPLECYPVPIEATASQPPCCGPPEPSPCQSVKDPMEGAVDIDVSDTCHVTVSADFIDCLWGEQWNTYTAGPVTVRYTSCSSPYETTSAPPPCACPPPQPLCYQVTRALAESPFFSIDDDCNVTVTLEAYCGLQGTPEDHTLKAPKVTVNYQTCSGGPPPQGAETAVPQCPPEDLRSLVGVLLLLIPNPPTASAQVALPLPQPDVATHADCTVTVTDTWTCPNGFENAGLNLREGPITVAGESCVPICRCMPMSAPMRVEAPSLELLA